jgi:hypothetical protein
LIKNEKSGCKKAVPRIVGMLDEGMVALYCKEVCDDVLIGLSMRSCSYKILKSYLLSGEEPFLKPLPGLRVKFSARV